MFRPPLSPILPLFGCALGASRRLVFRSRLCHRGVQRGWSSALGLRPRTLPPSLSLRRVPPAACAGAYGSTPAPWPACHSVPSPPDPFTSVNIRPRPGGCSSAIVLPVPKTGTGNAFWRVFRASRPSGGDGRYGSSVLQRHVRYGPEGFLRSLPEGFLRPRRRSKAPVAGPRLLAEFPVGPGIPPRPAEAPSAFASATASVFAFASAPRSPSPLSGGVEPHGRACKRSKSGLSVSALPRAGLKSRQIEPARAQASPYHRVSLSLCSK